MAEWVEVIAKTVDEALTEALIKLDTTSDNVEYEVIEKESKFLGLFAKPAKIRVRCKEQVVESVENLTVEEVAKNFLNKLLKAMKIDASVESSYDEKQDMLDINLCGNDMGVLIGKRGQTLDSLQYLTSLVVNKETSSYVKVKLDTENYRERRKETLENLAKNIAYKVKRTKHSVSLEPMNPYERRIIHSALQYDKYVETHSEGDEPYRRVVVTIKKSYRDYSRSNYNKSSYNRSYNRSNSDHGVKKESIDEKVD